MRLARNARWNKAFVLMGLGMISLTLAGLSVNRALADAPTGYHLSLDQEFNGTYTQDPDGTYTTALNTQTQFVSGGWDYPSGNISNAAVQLNNDGCLTLKTYSVYNPNGSISSSYGGLVGTTYNQFTYGYYETRMNVHQSAPQTWARFLAVSPAPWRKYQASPASGRRRSRYQLLDSFSICDV